jgi:Arc/MetJ-type ribon-helix-helix transcriptional regulator
MMNHEGRKDREDHIVARASKADQEFLEKLVVEGIYYTKSEAVRDAIRDLREKLKKEREEA